MFINRSDIYLLEEHNQVVAEEIHAFSDNVSATYNDVSKKEVNDLLDALENTPDDSTNLLTLRTIPNRLTGLEYTKDVSIQLDNLIINDTNVYIRDYDINSDINKREPINTKEGISIEITLKELSSNQVIIKGLNQNQDSEQYRGISLLVNNGTKLLVPKSRVKENQDVTYSECIYFKLRQPELTPDVIEALGMISRNKDSNTSIFMTEEKDLIGYWADLGQWEGY